MMKPGQNQVLYALYGVVEHSGTLHGGHYVAYVKVSLASLVLFVTQSRLMLRDNAVACCRYVLLVGTEIPDGHSCRQTVRCPLKW